MHFHNFQHHRKEEKMEKADQTMIDNIKIKFGKSLEEWIKILRKEKLEKHGEILKFLKEEHGFTHGYANLVSMKVKKSRCRFSR